MFACSAGASAANQSMLHRHRVLNRCDDRRQYQNAKRNIAVAAAVQQQQDEQQIPQEAARVRVHATASNAAAAVATPDILVPPGSADPAKHKGRACGPKDPC